MKKEKTNGQLKLDSLKQVETVEQDGAWFTVQHPALQAPLYLGGQSETPFRICVVGTYSKTYRDADKAMRKRFVTRHAATITEEEKRDAEYRLLAECTLGWEGAFDDDGAPIPFTTENVVTLYKAGRFVAEQVDQRIGDHALFFAESSLG